MNETERALRAEIAELRAEVARKDAALAAISDRLLPVEQAREDGAREEREARLAAERELRRLQATKLYRALLRPRDAIFRFRERRGLLH